MTRTVALLIFTLTSVIALGATLKSHWDGIPPRDHARPNPMASQSEAIHAGALVYRDHCQQCHQTNAEGDGHKHPSLRSSHIRDASDGDIEWFLRQGDLRHGMPSWSSLPQAQRWQLVAYLRSIQQ
jgi:mono/diheme cytochrome c family protein